ncbi:MAG TPA: Hsp33 family molecular chaperone HslO [Stellaceae bacterium]|nr:Hsp33 family molecular chaperone HslO [Stellaceae bacterium]
MSDPVPDDLVQPFQIDPFQLRGQLVRLGPLIDRILTQHAYPEPVAALLGEAIALAVALARALKYEGVFTLQTKGEGPVRLMVADVTAAGAVRGYAQYDADKLARAIATAESNGTTVQGSVPRLLGTGYLALTVDQGEHTDRYQGIVELQGATLAQCIHHYFRQSEQVEAGLKVAVARLPQDGGVPRWRAGCLMIERLPAEDPLRRDAEDDGWRRAVILMSSSTSKELVDPLLAPRALLYRLFHEDGVRAYAPRPLAAQCRCTRERVETMLRALAPDELEDMKVEGRILVTCQFCSAVYEFADDAIAALAER